MRQDFDVIIFDTPPVLALPDACVLGQLTDVTLLVTRSRHTRMGQIERAATTLNSRKVTELVVVVTHVEALDAAADGLGRGYGYGYGYGYGMGYGHENRRGKQAEPGALPAGAASEADNEDTIEGE